jgi:hypothetical protein
VPKGRLKALHGGLHRLDLQRERRLEQHAIGAIGTEELRSHLAEADRQKAALREEIGRLGDAWKELRRLEDLERLVPEYLRELPLLLERPHPRRRTRSAGGPENPRGQRRGTPASRRRTFSPPRPWRRRSRESTWRG